jgi:hypothetical protein
MALCEYYRPLLDMKTQTLIITKHSYYLSGSNQLIPKPTSDIIMSQVQPSPTCLKYFPKSDPYFHFSLRWVAQVSTLCTHFFPCLFQTPAQPMTAHFVSLRLQKNIKCTALNANLYLIIISSWHKEWLLIMEADSTNWTIMFIKLV